MIVSVVVGVSLGRPPRDDATVYAVVAADSEAEAHLIACQLAACWPGVVMPVSSAIVEILAL